MQVLCGYWIPTEPISPEAKERKRQISLARFWFSWSQEQNSKEVRISASKTTDLRSESRYSQTWENRISAGWLSPPLRLSGLSALRSWWGCCHKATRFFEVPDDFFNGHGPKRPKGYLLLYTSLSLVNRTALWIQVDHSETSHSCSIRWSSATRTSLYRFLRCRRAISRCRDAQ